MCLERRFKLGYSSTFLTCMGRLFHSSATALENERWPNTRVHTVVEIRFNLDEDRRLRVGLYSCMSSCNYSGANLRIHMNVRINILCMIRYLTGSQCNFWNTGGIWLWKRVRVTSLAAEFCILWSFAMCESGRPSIRHMINAWMRVSVDFSSR